MNNKQKLHIHTTYADGKDKPEDMVMEFLKEFNRLGFGAVITSDCHDKSFIDCFFDEAEALISAAGFKSKWILTENGFKEVGL